MDLLSEVRQMKAKLSDYKSCDSSDNDDNGEDTEPEFKTFNQKKRGWKAKRKNSTTPQKDTFLKKANTNLSPKQNL